MKTKLAGRLTLQEAIAATLADAKAKIAASRGEAKEEKKEDKLVAFEKKEHGHLPSVKEEKEECEKKASASVIDPADPEEVEKLAAALDEASELLVKESAGDIGGEKKQGGELLGNNGPVGGKQPYKKDKAHHQVPTHTGMQTPKDAPGAATSVPEDAGRAPGGTGAKYPAEGPLRKKGSVESLQEVVQAAIESQGTGEPIVEEAEVPEVEKQASKKPEPKTSRERAERWSNNGAGIGAGLALGGNIVGGGSVANGIRDAVGAGATGYGLGRLAHRVIKGKASDEPLKNEEKKEKESAAAPETKETAVDFILGKLAKVENGGESKQGGEQLATSAPVPSNPGRQMISSNAAPAKATKREAKAEPKRELKAVLTEPALTASTDSKVQENLRNASKGGVKIAAAKALFAKIAAEGCQCGGDKTCRYCKMKKAAADIKAKAETEKSEAVPSEQ